MKKNILNFIILCGMVFTTWSCSEMLDTDPGEVVLLENRYTNINDVQTAITGVEAQLYDLAKYYVILGELRGDLIDLGPNADEYLRQINEHRVVASSSNPYTSISKFYKVINNCNDLLANLKIMYDKKIFKTEAEFKFYYAIVLSSRNWVYFITSVHFGSIPYINKAITSPNPSEKFPVLNTSQMVDSLIVSMEPYKIYGIMPGLIGDLYLWKGDYYAAASSYKMELENTSTTRYKLTPASGVTKDGSSNKWDDFFTGSNTDEEMVTFDYDTKTNTDSNLPEMFNNENGGLYLLKPSRVSVDNWERVGDIFRGDNISYTEDDDTYLVKKYIYGVDDEFENTHKIFTYRSGLLWLRYCEAVNRYGKPKLAWDILNNGPKANYVNETSFAFKFDTVYYKNSDEAKYRDKNLACMGIRGRVNLASSAAMIIPGALTTADSVKYIEQKIFEELALETAYEGNRWIDFMRYANRMIKIDNDLGGAKAFVASGIEKKFSAGNSPVTIDVKARLDNPDNWFLPVPKTKDITTYIIQ